MAPGQFGQYKIIKVLGVGLTAEVYLARDKKSKKQLAIKHLRKLVPDPAMKGKFLEEGEKAARLNHPGIVPILETNFDQDTRPYIVMPFIPGKTLRQKYPRESRLPLEFVLSYTRQLADALAYVHQQQIVHCDVKPENVLVGENGHLFLCDFGTARIIDATLPLKTGNLFGTPTYMAPEQFRGKYDWATDQYALAIMVYEWLCGHPPFSGENQNQLMDYHMLMPVPSLRDVCAGYREDITEEVEQVVLKALAKKPHERFSSIQEFAQALEQALPALHSVQVQQTGPVPLWRPQGPNIHERGGLTPFHWYIITQRLQGSLVGREPSPDERQILDYAAFSQTTEDRNFASRDYLHERHWQIIQHLFQNGELVLPKPGKIRRYLSKTTHIGTVQNDIVTYAAMEGIRTAVDYAYILKARATELMHLPVVPTIDPEDNNVHQGHKWNGNNWEISRWTEREETTVGVVEDRSHFLGYEGSDSQYEVYATTSYTETETIYESLPSTSFTQQHAKVLLSNLLLTPQEVPDVLHASPELLGYIFREKIAVMPEVMSSAITEWISRGYEAELKLPINGYSPQSMETVSAFLQDAYSHHFTFPNTSYHIHPTFNNPKDARRHAKSKYKSPEVARWYVKPQEVVVPFIHPVPKSKAV